MPDRETVLKGMEEISDYFYSVYRRSTDREEINKAKDRCDVAEDALALLKEQDAVAPNPIHNSFRWFACGKCDCSITKEDRFCPRCGRAVKWE